jgi:plastocyanin
VTVRRAYGSSAATTTRVSSGAVARAGLREHRLADRGETGAPFAVHRPGRYRFIYTFHEDMAMTAQVK